MADRRDRERREFVDPDAHLATQTASGGKLCLKFPAKASRWEPKAAGTYMLEIYPFKAGKQFPVVADRGKWVPNCSFCWHRGVGPNKDTVLCPGRTYREKCFVCDYRAKMGQGPDKDKDVEKALKDLMPKDRQLWNVYNHDEKEKGWQIFEISFYLFGKNISEKIGMSRPKDRERYKTYWYPGKEGMTLKVLAKEESSPMGKFIDFSQIEFVERGPKLIARLDGLGDPWVLDGCLRTTPYDEVKQMFLAIGGDDDEDKDEEDDDTTDDEEDDDEEGEDGDEGDDEDEDELDGEDEDAEEEEDEEDEVTPPAFKGDKVRFKGPDGDKMRGTVLAVLADAGKLKVKDAEGVVYRVAYAKIIPGKRTFPD